MKTQRKKKKQSDKRKKLLFILISIAILFLAFFAISKLKNRYYLFSFQNPFMKHGIVMPIPKNSNDYTVEKILSEKGVSLASPPVASHSAYFFTLTDGTIVLLNQEKPLSEQVESLQIIQARLTIEGRRAKRIDLRFENPVVVY